jgi:hypothetical protein
MNGVTQVSAHTFEIGGMGAAVSSPVVEIGGPVAQSQTSPAIQQPAVVAAPTVLAAPASGRPPTLREQMAQMKARLREVKRELASKKALERERDQLQRLIQAATKEIDNVRRLRAAG